MVLLTGRDESGSGGGSDRRRTAPLWYLVLRPDEYTLWTREALLLMTLASAPFAQVNGPNLIALGLWEILEELELPMENVQIERDQ